MEAVDPYEQQLLAVFESCDDFSLGSLGTSGLHQLCQKLQLEDHYNKLVKCLIGEVTGKRVLFHEFRDGLLKLLKSTDGDQGGGGISPSREVSPKYVFGKKKYGRRSRPENNENEVHLIDEADDVNKAPQSCSSDDGSSTESVPKKRRARASKRGDAKAEEKYLGCEEGSEKFEQVASPSITSTTNEEECLIAAWSSISRGVTDSLSRDELVKVFQCIGLESGSEEAAQQVFEKLSVEGSGRITLQELLEFVRSGVNLAKDVRTQHLEVETCQKTPSLDFIDFSNLSCITGANLVEQWENAGVPGAAQLLHNLGLSSSQQVDVSSLVSVLSEELKSLNDEAKSSRRNLDPYVALLRASSVLQNIHVRCLKSAMEHANAEKEKLRNDVVEANERALLLAQEVDDHHSKLERSTQQQVKILERRHAERIRELTLQAKAEQDALAAQNSVLEQKVAQLEQEENKNKSFIAELETENKILEQEHRTVADQLTALQLVKQKLEKDLESLSGLQQKVSEMESAMNDSDVFTLLERIQTLEAENTNLRDRNDELSIEVEQLSAKLTNTSIKKRSSPNNSPCISVDESMEEESVGGTATKRRGESFALLESADDSGGEEGSPRLGKLRKCSHAKDYVLTTTSLQGLQIHSLNQGENVEEDLSDNTATPPSSESHDVMKSRNLKEDQSLENVPFLQELKQIKCLEEDSGFDNAMLWESEIVHKINEKLKEMEEIGNKELALNLRGLLIELSNFERKDCCPKCLSKDLEIEKLEKELKEDKETNETELNKLKSQCKDLETSLELLKDEYEKTEDYWAGKLDEERRLFEDEHRSSDDKYAELLEKILEYEDMLRSERDQKQRLETIEEKVSFEKQVADIEKECEELRIKFEETLKEKEKEIEELKTELMKLEREKNLRETGFSVLEDDNVETNVVGLVKKSCGIEESKKCRSYGRRSFTFSSGDRKSRYCVSCRTNQAAKSLLADIKNLQETKTKYRRELDMMDNEREILYKDIVDKKRELTTCLTGNNNVNRVQYLEQKCQTLMMTLRQQQKQTEEILKNTWRQHKIEVKDLKSVLKLTEGKLKHQTKVIEEQLSKLSRTDLLVKDLFVENSNLFSVVQKLERQCHHQDKH